MKFRSLILFFTAIFLISVACDPYKIEIPDQGTGSGNTNTGGNTGGNEGTSGNDDIYTVKYPKAGGTKVKTLQTVGYFKETFIKKGITYYHFYGMDDISKAHQNVCVAEIDLDNPAYKVNLFMTSSDITSNVGKREKAIIAVNACYEQEAIYLKYNGSVKSSVSLDPDHLRFWKHEGAIVSDGPRKIGIINGAKGTSSIKEGGIQAIEVFKQLKEPTIFGSSPILIDDYDPIGTRFVPEHYNISNVSGFDAEDYRRHQGGRNPRVAAALTEDNDLLLVVVDGRFSGKAEGMSAKELTNFLVKHFNPQWAINMDGGGSSTMFVNMDGWGVMNYPTDNKTWDHEGERARPTFFLVQYNE